jgi:type VI secretion system secreted protein Hcp
MSADPMSGKWKFPPRLGLILLLACTGVSRAGATFDAYLKLEGVPGEATDADHKDWILIESVSWAVSRESADALAPGFSHLSIVKPVDKATPLLLERCASGTQIPAATIELLRAEGERLRFFEIKLEDVLISSVANSGSADSTERPREEASLAFGRIEWTYTEFDLAGKPVMDHAAYWDLVRNEGGLIDLEPVLRLTAVRLESGGLELNWTTRPEQTYRILGSEGVTGPYVEVMTVSADGSGAVSQTIPAVGARGFFIVEEVP